MITRPRQLYVWMYVTVTAVLGNEPFFGASGLEGGMFPSIRIIYNLVPRQTKASCRSLVRNA